ncbi:MAG: hypothetical protein ACE5IY_11800 [bacterium]
MECTNHTGVEAVERCVACAEGFCANCLVEIQGQTYCGECKYVTVKRPPVPEHRPTVPCKEASDALTCAIVGLFCIGFILEPVAIFKALKAKRMIKEDPQLEGAGQSTAALVIAGVYIFLFMIGVLGALVENV